MKFPRIFTIKRLGVAVALYLVLWALTALIGCPQARRYVLTRAELPSGIREMPRGSVYQCCAPAYWFRARSYAPFFVTVSFDVAAGDFAYGYTHVFIWFGVLREGFTTESSIT